MTRYIRLFAAAAVVFLLTSRGRAQTLIYWQGGTGALTDANYSDGTNTNLAPQPTDYLHIGNGGVVTFNSSAGFGRLRVGHNQTPPGGTGAGTLTVTGAGNLLELTLGAQAPNAGIWIGNSNDGTVNVEEGAELKSSRLVVVGAGDSTTATGTLNVRTGGILTVSDGNLSIGDRSVSPETGQAGVVTLSDAASRIDIKGAGADLVVGPRSRTGTYTQTDGTVTVVDSVDVGTQSSDNTGSSFNISGGTITTGTTGQGNFFVGRGASVGATVNISGTAVVNVGNRYLMGGTNGGAGPTAIATGVVTNQSGGTLNTDLDIRVGDAFISPTSDATYNLSGTGIINTNTTNVTTGSSTVIGRQGTGKFIQTGGTANFNSPVVIGNREAATATTANGLYRISAGDLNVNAPTPTWPLALSVAPNGAGEFRVVGDDATINVTGDLLVDSTANGTGKLAFELEAGDLLSQINVAGNATFNASSILALDTTNAAPTQTTYDLLTAASITNSGLVFSGPAGWGIQIVDGGNGKILQAVQGIGPSLPGDFNNDGKVDAGDYVTWRKNEVANATLANDNGVGNQAARYDLWRASFGNPPGSGAGAGLENAAVPEPASALLLGLALVMLTSTRRRAC